jgi:hypothetical protein
VTTLYRCKAPTDLVCRCGKVARRMRALEIDFDESHRILEYLEWLERKNQQAV